MTFERFDPEDPRVPADVAKLSNEAYRQARSEGCNCDPQLNMVPTAQPPFWSVVVEHDDWCKLVQMLRAAGAPLAAPPD